MRRELTHLQIKLPHLLVPVETLWVVELCKDPQHAEKSSVRMNENGILG